MSVNKDAMNWAKVFTYVTKGKIKEGELVKLNKDGTVSRVNGQSKNKKGEI